MRNTNPKFMAIVRLTAMGISWVALILTSQFGWEPFPYTDEQIITGVTVAFTIGTSIWGWYKNNPVTTYGISKEDEALKVLGTRKEFNEQNTTKEKEGSE